MSVTSGFNPELPRQWKRLFQIMEDYIDGNHLTDVYRKALNNRICLSVLGLGLNILASDFTGTEKRREIKKIISVPRYKQAYKQLDLSYFPMHWKLFYGCAKFGNTLGVYVLLIMIKKIIN